MSSVGFPSLTRTAFIVPLNSAIDRVSLPCIGYFGQSLPDDPVGTTTVTFSGVNAGSEIRVYLPDRTEVAGIETCAANQVLSWSVYAPGSPNNTVTVRIVSMAYKIIEFDFDITVGAVTLPLEQRPDPWYSNPA